ncbi:MAG: hypothetical protein ACIAQZ_13780 [Sedimentisphaeraceae bacterium JB056]
MTKINQIQNAIRELDGGAFQKLADEYLQKIGYRPINPIGSVVGSNKVRKGTPDTLIPLPNGKYIFAEHTTIAQNQVCGKFTEDIDKCFDESKTGVPVSKIERIVLCYTSQLSSGEIESLQKKCREAGVNLNHYGLSSISYDLLQKYPGVAKDNLGVEVDTGQIVDLDRFISLYEKNKLTTTLETAFHFRDKEINDLLLSLENNDITIISGKAGVGKSRIAVECFRQFLDENDTYKAYCIFNQNVEFYEDIRSYFSDSGNFLIFVDDANRVSGFQYIVQRLQVKRDDQNFKVLVTVRDYALENVKQICKPFGEYQEVCLNAFTEQEIKTLVQDEFEITNHLYLERIADISQGNARLAVMAALVAKEHDTLEAIRDASALYDKYYSSIKTDLEALKDEDILKVAGIVAFFRNIDNTNTEFMQLIERLFGIPCDAFWSKVKKLHDMEILDMYENEVVKVSDQVLATYILYLVFFKDEILDLSIIIEELFPKFKQHIVETINPIINNFNFDEIKTDLHSAIDKVWDKIKIRDKNVFRQLVNMLGPLLKPDETLSLIQEDIKSMDFEDVDIDKVEFTTKSNSSLPEFLSVLPSFINSKTYTGISIDLLLCYVKKRPKDTSIILHCLTDSYGFNLYSYRLGYYVQFEVVNRLFRRSDSGQNEYFSRLFIALSENYLHTHFTSFTERKGAGNICQFLLPVSDELCDLRKRIWNNLFNIYQIEYMQKYILDLLFGHSDFHHHSMPGNIESAKDIIKADAQIVLAFFKKEFDVNDLYQCMIVQKYLKMLKRLGLSYDKEIETSFTSATYYLYNLFTNKMDKAELKLNHKDFEEYRKKKISKLTRSFSLVDYQSLIAEISEIMKVSNGHASWEIERGISYIFDDLAEKDPSLYVEVVKSCLISDKQLRFDAWRVVPNLFKFCGVSETFEILSNVNRSDKEMWLFNYYVYLPEDSISPIHFKELSDLYSTAKVECMTNGFDFLLKYEEVEKGYILSILKIVLSRAISDFSFGRILSFIFYDHFKIYKQLRTLFTDQWDLLENIYLIANKSQSHFDHDGNAFSILIDRNISFIDRYFDDIVSRNEYLSEFDEHRDYSFIWQRDDYIDVMDKISTILLGYLRQQQCYCFGFFKIFFNKNRKAQTDADLIEKQDSFLKEKITNQAADSEFMEMLFWVIAEFDISRSLKFYKAFLDVNKRVDDFKNLPFGPRISTWSGSRVPILEQEIEFYQAVAALCASVVFLAHRQFIEDSICCLRKGIQDSKKRDFIEEI